MFATLPKQITNHSFLSDMLLLHCLPHPCKTRHEFHLWVDMPAPVQSPSRWWSWSQRALMRLLSEAFPGDFRLHLSHHCCPRSQAQSWSHWLSVGKVPMCPSPQFMVWPIHLAAANRSRCSTVLQPMAGAAAWWQGKSQQQWLLDAKCFLVVAMTAATQVWRAVPEILV